jgi:hypothetical protein
MHLQVRLKPALSPPDVEQLLRRLKDANVNLAGVGGSDVEFGGEFAFAVDDGQEDRAKAALDAEPAYKYRILEHGVDPELTLCWLENVAGALHACLESVSASNLDGGRIIRDLLVGVPVDGRIPVQIYSEEVRAGRRSKS